MTTRPDLTRLAANAVTSLFKKKETVDAGTFRSLLEPHKEYLYNFVVKALNFSEDADDVYQEAVMRAFKYRNTEKKKKNFMTWIFTIA
ncbi:MAG: RNA polymerase sigma factor, partial [bacterium]|nr:RNA polymerase sigma factor [bacterium]